MKHILTLVAVAFTMTLGACCTKHASCPMSSTKGDCAHGKSCPHGKKDCGDSSCCSTTKKK